MKKMVKIDKMGRLLIPKKIRERYDLTGEARVLLEDRGEYLVIIPVHTAKGDVVERIARMKLPVGKWSDIEKEIAKGRLSDEG
jgi:AbrB family looped-hinge helix DNA binding protein